MCNLGQSPHLHVQCGRSFPMIGTRHRTVKLLQLLPALDAPFRPRSPVDSALQPPPPPPAAHPDLVIESVVVVVAVVVMRHCCSQYRHHHHIKTNLHAHLHGHRNHHDGTFIACIPTQSARRVGAASEEQAHTFRSHRSRCTAPAARRCSVCTNHTPHHLLPSRHWHHQQQSTSSSSPLSVRNLQSMMIISALSKSVISMIQSN